MSGYKSDLLNVLSTRGFIHQAGFVHQIGSDLLCDDQEAPDGRFQSVTSQDAAPPRQRTHEAHDM